MRTLLLVLVCCGALFAKVLANQVLTRDNTELDEPIVDHTPEAEISFTIEIQRDIVNSIETKDGNQKITLNSVSNDGNINSAQNYIIADEDVKMDVTNISKEENDTDSSNTSNDTFIETFNIFSIVVTFIGLAANIITFITFSSNGKSFSALIRLLLQHQALTDIYVCIMALGLLLQPYMWMTDNNVFNFVLCQAWHGQALYWGGVLLSVWNLVFIAVERYIMVLYPLKHQNIRKLYIYLTFPFMYLFSVLLLGPAYLQVYYNSNTTDCENVYYFKTKFFEDFMHGYAIFWFFIVYAIPCTCFMVLYGSVLYSLRKRKSCPHLGASRIIDNANNQLTRTAITVAIVFIVSLSWDSWYYLLGFAGVVTYEFNTPLQVIGVFLSTFNSCANPFIYAASMPMFRRSLVRTLTCGQKGTTPPSTVHGSHSNSQTNSNNTASLYYLNMSAH